MEVLSAGETNRDSVKASTLHCQESTDRGNESNEAAGDTQPQPSFVPSIACMPSDLKIIESGEVEEKQAKRSKMPPLNSSVEPGQDRGLIFLEQNLKNAALSNKTASAREAGYLLAQN